MMKFFSLPRFVIGVFALLMLNACTNQTSPTAINTPATSPSPEAVPTETPPIKMDSEKSAHGGEGGQVIESGPYHLELLTLKEASGFHLDFYLQNGADHKPIANATVTGKLQLPDGSQQDLTFKYSGQDQHYTAMVLTQAPGEYKLAILSDINGKKVNGRFNFSY